MDGSGRGSQETSDQESELKERASTVLWPGSQDYISIDEPTSFPRFVARSDGPYVWDTNGKKYVDLFLGSGSVILGHKETRTTQGDIPGPSISLRSPIEVELGEKIQQLIPSVDRVAYFKTGSEAVHLALRSALRINEGKTIVSIGYHGWLPPLAGDQITANSLSVVTPEANEKAILEELEAHKRDLAAVLVGPAPKFSTPNLYEEISNIAQEANASVIMDEVKSAFRLSFPCLTTDLGLNPDFVVLGKAVANGCPLAILGAKYEVFERGPTPEMYSTFASEPTSLRSAFNTVRLLEEGGYDDFVAASEAVYDIMADATSYGDGILTGPPTFFEPSGAHLDRVNFARSLLNEGILFHPHEQLIVSAAHDDPDVLQTLETVLYDAANENMIAD